MTYQVLARKYRPQTFTDVIAQDHVTTTLRNAIAAGRISSSYIFCGPRGAGKTTVARILAKAVNCQKGPTPEPCGACDACAGITSGSSLDVLEIDAASNTSVDDIRALRENIRYLPALGRKRIYIIDEVHRLSGPAFDALLKTLEEPPSHAMFIFATTESHKVPDTILSRTQRFDFRRVGVADVASLLTRIAQAEGFTIDDDAARIVARRGDGSVRDSVSLLDQLLSFSSGQVTARLITEALGMVDRETLFAYLTAVAHSDVSPALGYVAQVADSGADLKLFVHDLAERYRMMTALAADAETLTGDLSGEERTRLATLLSHYSLGDLVRVAEIIGATLTQMRELDHRWLVEIMTLKLALMESTVRIEEALRALTSGGASTSGGAGGPASASGSGGPVTLKSPATSPWVAPMAQSLPPTAGADGAIGATSAASAPVTATQSNELVTIERVIAEWPGILDTVRRSSAMIGANLANAAPRELKGATLVMTLQSTGSAVKLLLEKSEYRSLIERLCRERLGRALTLRYEITPATSPGGAGGSSAASGSGDSSGFGRVSGASAPRNDAAKLVERALEEEPRLKLVLAKVNGEIVRVCEVADTSPSSAAQ